MEDWEIRLIEEYEHLSKNINKLEKFIRGEMFETLIDDDKNDLNEQLMYMRNYLMVLRRRIARHRLIEL